MIPPEQNNFEKEWQRAFENASIVPPDALWDKIELELDRKKRRPFLFFFRPSVIATGMAAALILVLGGVLFFNKNTKENQTVIAQNTDESNQSVEKRIEKPQSRIIQTPTKHQEQPNNNVLALAGNLSQFPENSKVESKPKNKNLGAISEDFLPIAMAKNNESAKVLEDKVSTTESKSFFIQSVDNQIFTNNIEVVLASNSRNLSTDISSLSSKKYTNYGSSRTLNRPKLVFDNAVPEVQATTSNESRFWVGVQSGVAPFDPNMKLGGLNAVALIEAQAFSKMTNNRPTSVPSGSGTGTVAVAQPQNSIKSGFGTNAGFAVGYKVAKKWNLESGLRYLRGNSTLQSNTYSFQQNGYVNTFLVDYLLQNASVSYAAIQKPVINTVVADASQFDNRYEYLMIPMQIGYEIGLSKKLGLNLLVGVSADIFLQNTIANDNTFVQEKSTINSSNKIYKPLNISGLGGIRANYLLSKHWQANIGSSYQHALFSGINTSTNLQMRLRMLGLNYGVNYRF